MTSTALTVMHPETGEILEPAKMDDLDLARFRARVAQLKEDIGEADDIIAAELVRRLDRAATWTLRVGEPTDGVQFEIKAPSPEAGTTAYLPDVLLTELRRLVERGTISETAAEAALKRTVSISAVVPLDADVLQLTGKLQDAVDVQIAGVNVRVTSASASDSAVVGGIQKLDKVPGCSAAIARARITVPAPPRKASVKVIRREDVQR